MKKFFLFSALLAMSQANILVQGAMPSEVATLLQTCKNPQTTKILSYEFTSCQIHKQNVIISKTLVGEINAAISTTLALSHFKNIDLVINQGTAGAHEKSLKKGDVIIGDKIYNLAAYISNAQYKHDLSAQQPMKAPLKLSENDDNKGFYTSDTKWVKAAMQAAKELNINVIIGPIASSDAFNRQIETINSIHKRYGSLAEEMEAIASAQTSAAFKVPYLSLRVISNNEINKDSFDESTAKISQNLVIKMLENLK